MLGTASPPEICAVGWDVKRIIILSLLLLLLSGCYSMTTKRQWFVDARNYDIGRNIGEIPIPEPKAVKIETPERSRYFYRFPNGCEWSFEVADRNKEVVSWRFESNPDLCFLTMNWGDPW